MRMSSLDFTSGDFVCVLFNVKTVFPQISTQLGFVVVVQKSTADPIENRSSEEEEERSSGKVKQSRPG